MKKGGYWSHTILVCTYKLYNFSVSMDWAVRCHLGRDKTIEKVSIDFIGEIIQKVNIKKAQERDKFYYDKKH